MGMTLRNIQPDDIDDLYAWRNHPLVRRNSFNSKPLSRSEHERWFREKSRDEHTVFYLACCDEDKVGVIRFDEGGDAIEVSVMLNPDFIGHGFGTRLIKEGTEKFIGQRVFAKPIVARIKEDNVASIRAFEKAGFRKKNLAYVWNA